MRSRWHRPDHGDAWIMGVLNCTPDSFSDGGNHDSLKAATAHGLAMWKQGADLIDVGGESTRPGAASVSEQDELARVVPVVRELAQAGVNVSVDTIKAEVMHQSIRAGAMMVNDVSALRHDSESLQVVAESGVDVCLMHMQGSPETMQQCPRYDDVVAEVTAFFEERMETCLNAGIDASAIVLDPGIGFGKRLEDNLDLIMSIDLFKERFGVPVLLGASRKSFIGMLTGSPVESREIETAVAHGIGIVRGADMVRVHNVEQQRRAAQMASALLMHGLHMRASQLS